MSRMNTNSRAPARTNATSVPMPYDNMSLSIAPPRAMILPTRLRAQAPDQVEHLRRVAARVDAVGAVADDALLVDDEGGAHQALVAHALGLLFLDHPVLAADLAFRVGEQRDGDAGLVAEVGVRQAVVARDAEHHAVVLAELVLV